MDKREVFRFIVAERETLDRGAFINTETDAGTELSHLARATHTTPPPSSSWSLTSLSSMKKSLVAFICIRFSSCKVTKKTAIKPLYTLDYLSSSNVFTYPKDSCLVWFGLYICPDKPKPIYRTGQKKKHSPLLFSFPQLWFEHRI